MKQQTIENLQRLITITKSKADLTKAIANAKQYNEDNLTNILDVLSNQPDDNNNWFIDLVISMMVDNKIDNPELDNLLSFCAELEKYGYFMEVALLNTANLDVRDYIDSDCHAYTYDELYEIADEDLKANGANASALYWFNETQYSGLHVFNGYANGFYMYDSMNEYLGDYAPQYTDLIDGLIEYLAE